jgi:hypothetical protein
MIFFLIFIYINNKTYKNNKKVIYTYTYICIYYIKYKINNDIIISFIIYFYYYFYSIVSIIHGIYIFIFIVNNGCVDI